ncbi:MAG: hypothetical protein ACWGSQ_17585, partial [Longimicrobiales bacterium]
MGPISDETLAYGARAAAALLGVDALYRGESDDGEGLVVVNMAGPGELEADPFDSYAAARGRFEALERGADDLPEKDRRTYYRQLSQSTLAFIRWREEGLPFSSQLEGFLHTPVAPAAGEDLDHIRRELMTLLTEMGYAGDLKARCAAWEDRNRVPAEEAKGVLEGLMDEAWDRTEERLMEIPALKSDGMRVAAVAAVGFNARCDYLKRTLELNTDPTLTLPGLKHLAVHEGYPGHYVQFKLRETLYRAGLAPADNLLSVVNTASSSTFEGIADTGLEMLEWSDTGDDRIQGLLNRHRAAIGTGAGGGIGLSLGSVGGNVGLNLRLSALEDRGSIRIISSPKITTSN